MRFPIPRDGYHADNSTVELRRRFMDDGRDVHSALTDGTFQTRSLTDEMQSELAIRWSAYALRRGPFVAEDTAEKIAELLVASGRTHANAVDIATKVANVVAAGWGTEGRGRGRARYRSRRRPRSGTCG